MSSNNINNSNSNTGTNVTSLANYFQTESLIKDVSASRFFDIIGEYTKICMYLKYSLTCLLC